MTDVQEVYSESEIDFEIRQREDLLHSILHRIQLADCMANLLKNDDFIKVFLEYYQTHYLNEQLEDLATSISEPVEKSARDKVKAIGTFRVFVKNLLTSKGQLTVQSQQLLNEISELKGMPTIPDTNVE